jgi:hypothetical protein
MKNLEKLINPTLLPLAIWYAAVKADSSIEYLLCGMIISYTYITILLGLTSLQRNHSH